jgi:hypothetical protein
MARAQLVGRGPRRPQVLTRRMGEPLNPTLDDRGLTVGEYCRGIETYLCRKNDGHLVRVVGPSFEIVSQWAAQGVPLPIAFRGIDRYFERYYRKGPRRRPVRIDFCEADVLETFDEWRRALGLPRRGASTGEDGGVPVDCSTASGSDSDRPEPEEGKRRGPSLPAHLERCVLKLTSARATAALDAEADRLIDQVVVELDTARSRAHGLRGEARRALVERLARLDSELLHIAASTLAATDLRRAESEADEELAPYRGTMSEEAFQRARTLAIDRFVRARFGLPTLTYS